MIYSACQHIESQFNRPILDLTENQYLDSIILEQKRKESILARHLIQQFFAETLLSLGFCKNSEGKPFFSRRLDLHLSITHAHGWVWVVVADFSIGIDLELYREDIAQDLEMAFSELEWKEMKGNPDSIFSNFCLKEAYSKKIGHGFLKNPAKFNLKNENYVVEKIKLHTDWMIAAIVY